MLSEILSVRLWNKQNLEHLESNSKNILKMCIPAILKLRQLEPFDNLQE